MPRRSRPLRGPAAPAIEHATAKLRAERRRDRKAIDRRRRLDAPELSLRGGR